LQKNLSLPDISAKRFKFRLTKMYELRYNIIIIIVNKNSDKKNKEF